MQIRGYVAEQSNISTQSARKLNHPVYELHPIFRPALDEEVSLLNVLAIQDYPFYLLIQGRNIERSFKFLYEYVGMRTNVFGRPIGSQWSSPEVSCFLPQLQRVLGNRRAGSACQPSRQRLPAPLDHATREKGGAQEEHGAGREAAQRESTGTGSVASTTARRRRPPERRVRRRPTHPGSRRS